MESRLPRRNEMDGPGSTDRRNVEVTFRAALIDEMDIYRGHSNPIHKYLDDEQKGPECQRIPGLSHDLNQSGLIH